MLARNLLEVMVVELMEVEVMEVEGMEVDYWTVVSSDVDIREESSECQCYTGV